MRRLRPAALTLLFATALHANAWGQDGSTQIYAPRQVAALSTDVKAFQTGQANEQGLPSFPSLKPRSAEKTISRDKAGEETRSSKIAAPTITVASSLAVVLGLFAALVWGSRKFGNGAIHKGSIPKGVLQSLGSTPIDARTRVTMLRFGNRIILLAQTAGSTQTLCEITDPNEVQELTAACVGTSKHDFATALSSMENETTSQSFLGTASSNDAPQIRRRLFTSA